FVERIPPTPRSTLFPYTTLFRSDAVERKLAGEILARFERRGLEIRAAKLLTVDRALAEEHYAEHKEKPFYGELVDFITSAPTLADRKSTRLNSSHVSISYAVFCL